MDPVSIVVAALTAGAIAGAQNTASVAVTDGYEKLKSLLNRRFAGRAPIVTALARHERAPQREAEILRGELIDTGLDEDSNVIEAAKRLLGLLELRPKSGYIVDARGAQGVQSGDGNTQTNTFGSPPPPV